MHADDATHFDVRSADGTSIAVWVDGQGPPLLVVHGAMSDHTNDAAFVAELLPHFETFAMDRRGRGASGDGPSYAIEREFEDIAEVIDTIAGRSETPVNVWGHSYGADCAMGAATRTGNIARLVLYEPGLGIPCPPGSIDAMNRALAAGDNEAAAVGLLTEVVGLTADELYFTRALPTWPARLAIVPTVPRELIAESTWVFERGYFARVDVPVLLLAGSESPPAQQEATRRAAGALARVEVKVLDGHSHIAHRSDPAFVADVVRDFLSD